MGFFEWGGKGYKFDWIIIGENGFKKIRFWLIFNIWGFFYV